MPKTFRLLVCVLAFLAVPGALARADIKSDLRESEKAFAAKDYVKARESALLVLREAKEGAVEYNQALETYGWSEFLLDNYLAAQGAFAKLGQLEKDNFAAELGMAWTSIKLGAFDQAQQYLDKADKNRAKNPAAVLDARGWLAIQRGKFDEAEAAFDKEDEKPDTSFARPYNPDPQVGRAWVAIYSKGDWRAAEKLFADGLSRDTKCVFCLDGLARAALQRGALDEALEHAVKGARLARHSNGIVNLLDAALIRLNKPKRSIEILGDLAKQYPKDAVYVARLGYAHLADNDAKQAEANFRKALELFPGHGLALTGLGDIQFRRTAIVKDGWTAYYEAKYEDALKSFEAKRAEAKAARNPAAEDGRGWALLALNRPKDALVAFRDALGIDPEFFYSRSGMISTQRLLLTGYDQAWALVDLGRYDEAKVAFERTRKDVPAEFDWLVEDGLAWIAYYQGNLADAEKAFRAIVAKNPEAYLSKKGLGFVALQRKDFDAAASQFAASFVQNPYQVLASYTTPALGLIEAGQFNKARDILELGERVYYLSADIEYLLARAYKGLNDGAKAAQKAVAAVNLAPAYIHPAFDKLSLPPESVKEAYNAMGWGLYYAGDAASAVKRFEQYFAAGGTMQSGQLGHAWALLAAGKPDAAEGAFKKALEKGEAADAHAGLGWVRLGKGQAREAEANFQKALSLAPGHLSAQSGVGTIQFAKTGIVKEGWALYFKADYDGALKAIEPKRGEAKAAGNPAAEDARGWALIALGRGKDATKAFDAALAIDPSFVYSRSGRIAAERATLVVYNRAWAQIDAAKYDDAERLFQQARSEVSKDFQWLVDDGLAWIAFYRGKTDEARKAFQDILDKNKDAYLSRKGLAFVAMEKRDYAAATKELMASLQQNPYQILGSYTAPAQRLIDAKEFQKAKEILEFGEKIYYLSADIQFLLAKTYKSLNDEAKAAGKAIAAAALAPAYVSPAFDQLGLDPAKVKTAYHAMAWGLYFAGDNEGAIKRFDQYSKLGGDDPNAGRGRGFALFRLAKYAEALVALGEAAKQEPSRLLPIVENVVIPGTGQIWPIIYDARSSVAWLYFRTGKFKEAEQAFRKVLEANPFWVDALTGLGYSQLALKDKGGAIKSFINALNLSPAYPDASRGLAEAQKKS